MKTELQRLLSKRGIASRKEATAMILAGKVRVNGQICLEPTKGFDPRVVIEIANLKIEKVKKYYLALHKLRGQVVTRSDEHGRVTIYENLTNWQGPLLQAVGRLDLASEGLLLLTNDHLLAEQIMNPNTHLKKIYHVQVCPIPNDESLNKLSKGIILEGKKTLPAHFELLRTGEKNAWICVELQEGRNRQIRKMFESESIEVLRLIRVQIGELKLGELAKGQWREINPDDVTG